MSRACIEGLEARQFLAVDVGSFSGSAFSLVDIPSLSAISIPGANANVTDVIQKNRLAYGSPGLLAATMKDGVLDEMAAVGVREAGKSERVRWGDPMLIGSATKAMTATLAARLVERGYIKWETTILDVFPGYAGKIRPTYYNVTLEQLLSHRGGLPENLTIEQNIGVALINDPMTARGNYLRSMLREKAVVLPGTYRYSNVGYIVAGAMMEQRMREPYENMMRRLVFEPLGMSSATFGWPRGDAPRGHSASGTPQDPNSILQIPGAYNPSGGVSVNIIDWSKFVGVQLGVMPKRFLTSASIAKLRTPIARDSGYALGWNTYDIFGVKVIQHDGTEGYWYASVVAMPQTRNAILVMSNRGGVAGERAVHQTIVDLQGKLFR